MGHYEAAWGLFPDGLPALEALAHTHRHAVLTNLSLIVKPCPGAFLAACAALDLAPHEAAYVGDHPEIDGRGAAEAGLLSVWIDRGTTSVRVAGDVVAHRIASLSELPALLRSDTRFGAPSTFG